jgi:hypothetical protein
MEPKSLVASLMIGSRRMLASFTLADAVVVALAIATAFLLGLWCGRVWQRRRTWSVAADDLKRRAQRG